MAEQIGPHRPVGGHAVDRQLWMVTDKIEAGRRNPPSQTRERAHDRVPVFAVPVRTDKQESRRAPVAVRNPNLVVSTYPHNCDALGRNTVVAGHRVPRPVAGNADGVSLLVDAALAVDPFLDRAPR